jgi:hypothetical protein
MRVIDSVYLIVYLRVDCHCASICVSNKIMYSFV